VAILAPRQPGVLLTVFGDGPYRGALERLADELGIADRVDFRGHVETSREVWETLGRARAAAYDWDEIARRIEALCEKLISARPHPRPLS
jgi:glycosyltransferase involved in cell wall biosynthesis